jgi:glycosyltransferase involved in cell wall biosynthesis
LKIAILGSRGYPSTYGGFETFVRVLAPNLRARGHEVTVYGRMNRPRHRRFFEGDIGVIDVLGLDSKQLSTLSSGLTASVDAALRGFDAAIVVNVANAFFLPFLRARGIGTVLNVDGLEWERGKWGRAAQAAFRSGAKLAAKWSDRLVADSRAISATWLRDFGVEPTFIPYGADLVASNGSRRVTQLGLEHEQYVLVVARFAPENNIDLTLDAIDLLTPRPPLVVVGTGNYRSPLDSRLDRLEGRGEVLRLGHVNDPDLLNDLWSHAGVYVHGHSVGGTNPALLQALAAGAPTLAFPSPFNDEVVGTPRLLYERAPSRLAHRVRDVLASPGVREEMRTLGRARIAAAYQWSDVCDAYERELSLVAERRR